MKLISIIKIREYGLIAIFSAAAMALIYPYLQVALNGGFFNYFFWFETLLQESVLNLFAYLSFSALFGIVLSLGIYNWRNKTCGIKNSMGSGGFGSLLGIFTSQCSACLSLASLFLPTAAVAALTVYNTFFNFISIAILLLAIHLMGGFRE